MTRSKSDPQGAETLPYFHLDKRPCMEVGYGVENIFKLFAVEAFHRLTYLEHPNVRRFALKFSMQIIL